MVWCFQSESGGVGGDGLMILLHHGILWPSSQARRVSNDSILILLGLLRNMWPSLHVPAS